MLGSLNAPVTNYIFKWIGKPKDNGFYEANKQFIAPLPLPRANAAERAGLSALAKGMQERRTAQVAEEVALEERLAATARGDLPLERLLPGVRGIEAITETKPKSIDARQAKRWTDDERAGDEEAALARIDALIRLDSEFVVTLAAGKLSFIVDEQEAARLFVGEHDGPLIEAQWRATAIAFQPTGKDDARRLVARLRRVATTADAETARQIVTIGRALAARDVVLRDDEAQLHEMTCRLFKLTPKERALVEAGR